MTDDTLNPEAIRADMEAGTPGRWTASTGRLIRVFTMRSANDPVVVAGAHRIGKFRGASYGCAEANGRRIARVPDLEQGYLDMCARAEAAEAALRFYADKANWRGDEEAWERAEAGDDDPETLDALISAVEMDGGKRARAALTDTQEDRADG